MLCAVCSSPSHSFLCPGVPGVQACFVLGATSSVLPSCRCRSASWRPFLPPCRFFFSCYFCCLMFGYKRIKNGYSGDFEEEKKRSGRYQHLRHLVRRYSSLSTS